MAALMHADNLVLIGMPGSGKSTLGRSLAQRLGKSFIDTDKILEKVARVDIQSVVNYRGLRYFRRLEAEVLTDLSAHNCVIATGGSAVYSASAMRALGDLGPRVYLRISLANLLLRVRNQNQRGLVKLPGASLQSLYQQRRALYEYWADLIVDNNRPLTQIELDRIVAQIVGIERGQ